MLAAGTNVSIKAGTMAVQGAGSLVTDSALNVGDQAGSGAVNQFGGSVSVASVNLATGGLTSSGTYYLGAGMLSTGNVTGSSGMSKFIFNGGTLQLTADNSGLFAGVTNLQVQNGGAVIDTNGHNVTLAQGLVPAAGSTGGLTKLGLGNLVFGGSGNVNVSFAAGSLIDVQAGLLTGSSSYQGLWTTNQASLNIAAGATFNAVEAGTTATMQIDALTGAGTFLGGYFGVTTVTLGVAGGSGVFGGVLADNSGGGGQLAIVKSGSGTETFSGANTYTGPTTVNGGTLKIVDQALSSTTASVASGAVLEANDSGTVFQSTMTYQGTGTLRKTGAGTLVFGGLGTVNVNFSAGALIDVQEVR